MEIQIKITAPADARSARLLVEALGRLIPGCEAPGATGAEPAPAAPSPEALALAASRLVDDGRGAEVRRLLAQKYGVQSLPELPDAARGDFARDMREMGAKL